jgi:hypothetical protein
MLGGQGRRISLRISLGYKRHCLKKNYPSKYQTLLFQETCEDERSEGMKNKREK